jgi:hypothetical protein
MPFLNRASGSEPFLILSDEDYRRAFAPEAAPASQGTSVPISVRRRKQLLTALGFALVLAGGGGVWVFRRPERAEPAASGPVVSRAPEPIPKSPAPLRRVDPPAALPPPPPPAPLPPVAEPEEEAKPVVEAPREMARALWNGGRAWVQVQLRMEHHSKVQETRHRATIVWDGVKYAVQRPPSGLVEIWMERLELLLNLPQEDESWQRQTTGAGTETLHVQSGDLACRFVEGEDRFPQGVRSFRYWYSDEFPAGAIQAQLTFRDMKLHCRVLAFGRSTGPDQKP